LTTFSYAFLAVLCVCSLLFGVFAVIFAARRTAQPFREARALSLHMQSLQASQDETAATLKDLANRVKMMRVRTAINHVSDPPIAESGVTVKDALRRQAGLTAGRPVKHQ